MTVQGVKFSGVGAAIPRQCLTNAHLSALVDTSDEWIQSRTGIQERHVAAPDQRLVDLASEAAGAALQMAGLEPTAVDLIILATSTPDDLFGTACLVQTRIGAINAVAFDLTAACSGFLFALVTAAQYLRTVPTAVPWSLVVIFCRAGWIGAIAAPAFSLAMAPARWSCKPAMLINS